MAYQLVKWSMLNSPFRLLKETIAKGHKPKVLVKVKHQQLTKKRTKKKKKAGQALALIFTDSCA